MNRRPPSQRGFTLIELMLAVTIVGILATITLTSYRGIVLKSNRSVAVRTLAELANRQEAQFLQQRAYTTTFAALNGATGTRFWVDREGRVQSALANSSIYRIEFSGTASATAWTLLATAVGSQIRDSNCATLSLSSTGVRAGSALSCWDR